MERIAQAELGLSLSATKCRLIGVWDHICDNSAVSEKISTHHVSLPYILYVDDDLDLVADDQHRAIRWFDLEEVSQSCEHHKYMNHYAGWVLEDLRVKKIESGNHGRRIRHPSLATVQGGHPKQFLSLHSENHVAVDR